MDAPNQPPGRPLRVLLIEDLSRTLSWRCGASSRRATWCTFRCVVNELEMRAALDPELPDLILSDFSLPGFEFPRLSAPQP